MEENKKLNYSIQEIHQVLKERGIKLTSQRECVLEMFFELKHGLHLSVEDIYKVLSKKNKAKVSLATVYRTVKTLHLAGILREIDLAEGHKHYELSSKENAHHHIICLNCNDTIEFFSDEINSLAEKIAQQNNVEILDIELKIFAKCREENARVTDKFDNHLGLTHHRR